MKNPLLYFLLFIFHFSFGQKQDTLFYTNGSKKAVKIVSVNNEITYGRPNTDSLWKASLSSVNYIKYSDGGIYRIGQAPKATVTIYNAPSEDKWKCVPYILVSGGTSSPFLFGYGNNVYAVQDDETGNWSFNDAGYAKSGTTFSATAGLVIYHGWEITGTFSYFQNGIDATGYMNKTAALFIDNLNRPTASESTCIPITNVSTTGTYTYTNYSILYGITKSWENKNVGFGLSFMLGDFINKTPEMTGVATYQTGYTYPYTNTYYTLNINSQTQNNFAFEIGMHLDVKITKHLFLRGLLEYEYSTYSTGGSYQLVDMNSGNTFVSGGYYGNNLNISLFNATAGVGYKF
jgi:hypothetical protein